MSKQNLAEQIAMRRAALQADLATARSEYEDAAVLNEKGEKGAREKLRATERALEEAERALAANAVAHKRALEEHEIESKVDHSERAKKALADVATLAGTERPRVAREIDQAFKRIGALLTEWERLGQVIRENAYSICDYGAEHDRHLLRIFEPIARLATGNADGAAAAIAHDLAANGIGVTGVYVDALNGIKPSGAPFSLEDFAQLAADRLLMQFNGLIEKRQADEKAEAANG